MGPERIRYSNSISGLDSRAQAQNEHIREWAPSVALFDGVDDPTVNSDGVGMASCPAPENRHSMSSISVIGLGNMARALAGGGGERVLGRTTRQRTELFRIPINSTE